MMFRMTVCALVCAGWMGATVQAEVSVVRMADGDKGGTMMERLYAVQDLIGLEHRKDNGTRRVLVVEDGTEPLLRKEVAKRRQQRGSYKVRIVPACDVVAVSNEMVRMEATPVCRRAVSAGFEASVSRASMLDVRQRIAAAGGRFDVVFAGDSITHFISDKIFAREFGEKVSCLNLGRSGDTVQNLVYRLENGQLDGYNADLFVVMIGTNNREKAEEIAEGIRHVLDLIRAKHPTVKVVLTSLLPRDGGVTSGSTKRNVAVNEIVKGFADDKDVFYIDVTAAYLKEDGTIDTALMNDRLHPTSAGYTKWLSAVKPFVDKYAGTCVACAHPQKPVEPIACEVRTDAAGHEVGICRLSALKGMNSIDAMCAVRLRLKAQGKGVTLFVNDGCDPLVLQEYRNDIDASSRAFLLFPEELEAFLPRAFELASIDPTLTPVSHIEDGYGSYQNNLATIRRCIAEMDAKCRAVIVGGGGLLISGNDREFKQETFAAGCLALAACDGVANGIFWRLENGLLDGYTTDKVYLHLPGTPAQIEFAKEIVRRKQPQAELIVLDPKKHYSYAEQLEWVKNR